jgi:hypothetical protein
MPRSGDHDVPEAAEPGGVRLNDPPQTHRLVKFNQAAVSGDAGVRGGTGGGNGLHDRAKRHHVLSIQHIGQPIIHAAGGRIDGCVRRIDGDVVPGEL